MRRLESDSEPITRERIAAIKAALATPGEEDRLANTPLAASTSQTERIEASPGNVVTGPFVKAVQTDPVPKPARGSLNGLTLSYTLLADLEGRVVEVVVDCAPSEDGNLFVRTSGASSRQVVSAGDLKLIRRVPRSAR